VYKILTETQLARFNDADSHSDSLTWISWPRSTGDIRDYWPRCTSRCLKTLFSHSEYLTQMRLLWWDALTDIQFFGWANWEEPIIMRQFVKLQFKPDVIQVRLRRVSNARNMLAFGVKGLI
jgi:hypothetical protein